MRVLFLTQGKNTPSSRFRAEQLLPALRQAGVQAEAWPTNPSLRGEWDNWNPPQPLKEILRPWSVVERFRQMSRATSFDLVVIQKPLIRYGNTFFERWLSQKVPCIYDLDDALFHNAFGLSGWQLKRVANWMHHLILGNQYLSDFFQMPEKTTLIPTVIDTNRYPPRPFPKQEELHLVWTGIASNIRELKVALPALQKFFQTKKAKLILVSDSRSSVSWLSGLPVDYIPWSPENEVKALESAHIGLMPLRDSKYNRGKCGFKLIQYMARGIPVITTPVGANKQIVTPGVQGFWAETEKDWLQALQKISQNPEEAKRMGEAARAQVLQNYSIDSAIPKYLSVFEKVLSSSRAA